MRDISTPELAQQASDCKTCWKPLALCVCSYAPSLRLPVRFLVLQHPQEKKKRLGSGRLLTLAVPGSVHRVGLSWRSLSHALGERDEKTGDWAVLFLGTQKNSAPADSTRAIEFRSRRPNEKSGRPRGIVLLDGNWKQSKTLWWRNPWLLKLHRVLLNPEHASLYGTLRRQPRARCLSTLEAGAEVLRALGHPQASDSLVEYFQTFLEQAQLAKPALARRPPLPSEPPSPLAP